MVFLKLFYGFPKLFGFMISLNCLVILGCIIQE